MAWAGKAGGVIVDLGAPLGDGKAVGAGEADNEIAGFSILESGSEADFLKLLENHPHFHAPGGSIEVHEFLSMPDMRASRSSAERRGLPCAIVGNHSSTLIASPG